MLWRSPILDRVDGDHLSLPPRLRRLTQSGAWSAASGPPTEVVAVVDPDEVDLNLYGPPFRSLATELVEQELADSTFWADHGAIDQLDPGRALLIGDFGLGSDSPIILDYRQGPDPVVRKLAWVTVDEGTGWSIHNSWPMIARSFDELADRLGLP